MTTTPSAAWFKAQAVDKTGLDDFGDDYFEAGLAAYSEDLKSGHLTELGQGLFTRQMVNDLSRRLQVIDYLKQNPEISEVEIPPILYVSGLERTGTTLLHNLLTLDPCARALRRWELMYPVPAPEPATWATDPRIAKVQASIDRLRGSKLEHMHWVEAVDPEECYWGLLNGFGVLGGTALTAMPRFTATRTDEVMYRAIREYRSVIRILLWKNPPPAGGHLVLKSPQFCGYLGALKRALPESHLVVTHRDPHRAVVSVCNLQAHILQPFLLSDEVYERHGPIASLVLEQTPGRLVDIVRHDAEHQVANVAYPELVGDPVAVVEEIYAAHDFALPPALPAAVADFIAAQKAGKRARPTADFADFGIDADELLAEPDVRTYCERFGLQREGARITGA